MPDQPILDARAVELAQQAAAVIKSAQEQTSLSLMELAVVFRIAATVCDESNSMYERAQMASKLRGWNPGKP